MRKRIYTVGHSTHSLEKLLVLLKRHDVSAVADVRSSPYSRFNPQFNREPFKAALKKEEIAYVFLGRELGARSEDRRCYEDGKVQYSRLAQTELFQEGLSRIEQGMTTHRVALLCAEKDPLTCHRTILVCRHLVDRGIEAHHILEDGRLESHGEALDRLLSELNYCPENELFDGRDELIEAAYTRRGNQIAYVERSHRSQV